MHSEPPTTADEDARIERLVLLATLDAYPEIYSKNELVREITQDPREFAICDAVERVVTELSAIGLLYTFGPLVIPSRAALRVNRLTDA
jgi:hypothetical protein